MEGKDYQLVKILHALSLGLGLTINDDLNESRVGPKLILCGFVIAELTQMQTRGYKILQILQTSLMDGHGHDHLAMLIRV